MSNTQPLSIEKNPERQEGVLRRRAKVAFAYQLVGNAVRYYPPDDSNVAGTNASETAANSTQPVARVNYTVSGEVAQKAGERMVEDTFASTATQANLRPTTESDVAPVVIEATSAPGQLPSVEELLANVNRIHDEPENLHA